MSTYQPTPEDKGAAEVLGLLERAMDAATGEESWEEVAGDFAVAVIRDGLPWLRQKVEESEADTFGDTEAPAR